MQTHTKITIFILCLTSILFITQSRTQYSLLRTYSDKHNLLGIKGQWTGHDCDDECHQAHGQVCGRVWKQCCALGCEGVVQVSCKQDKFIPESELKCFSLQNDKNSKTQSKPQQTPVKIEDSKKQVIQNNSTASTSTQNKSVNQTISTSQTKNQTSVKH